MSAALILVTLRLAEAVGGHRASGWRATCRFGSITATDGADLFGVQVDVVGPSRIDPGEELLCVLRLWAAEFLPGPIEAGTHLTIFEGAKQVAIGTAVTFTEVGND